MFNDLSIKERLIIGFSGILLLMALVVILIGDQSAEAKKTVEVITDRLAPQVKALSTLGLAIDRQRTDLRGYVLYRQQKIYAEYKEALANEKSARLELASKMKNPVDKRTFEMIESQINQLHLHEANVIKLSNAGKTDLAFSYHLKYVHPLALSIENTADSLGAMRLSQMQNAGYEFHRRSANLVNMTHVCFALGLVFTIIFIVATVRSVTHPTRSIAKAAETVAEGDYEIAAAFEHKYAYKKKLAEGTEPRSELQQIALALAKMAGNLKRREHILQVHGKISAVCASTIEIQSLLDNTLMELAHNTDSQVAAVYVTDDNGPAPRGTYGISLETAEAVLNETDGFVKQVLKSGKRLVLSNIPDDARFIVQPGFGKIIPKTIACMPMMVENQVVGVTVLASLHIYDTETLALMEASVAQIGVALSNAIRHQNVQNLAIELQNKNEQLDAQNEELQCQNEELQAQSEEIQVQNEELLTQGNELVERNAQLESTTKDLAALAIERSESYEKLKLAETLVRSERERLQTIIDNLPQGVIISGMQDGSIEMANQATLNMYGLDTMPDAAEAFNFCRLDGTPIAKEDQPLNRSLIKREVCTGEEMLIRQTSGSEIAVLCNSVPLFDENGNPTGAIEVFQDITTIKEHQRLLENVYENQRHIAETLQKSFLPSLKPVVPGYEIGDSYIPAQENAEVGGDFYDLLELSEEKLGVVIGDVSGKGVDAAVHTAMAKYMLRAFAHEDPTPASVLTRVNDAVTRYVRGEIFVTLFYGVLDIHENTLIYANGGHEQPLIFNSEDKKCIALESTGPAVGVIENSIYKQKEVKLSAGDSLILYTDGITEARCDKEALGPDGFELMLSNIGSLGAQDLTQEIIDKVRSYTDGVLRDDVALLVIKSCSNN